MATEEVSLKVSLKDRAQAASGLKEVKTELGEVGSAARRSGAEAAEGAKGFQLVTRSVETMGTTALGAPAKMARAGRESAHKWGEGFRESAKGMLLGIGGFFAAEHLFEFGKESIEEAAQTQQAATRAQMLFGKESAETLEGFNKRAADSYGVSEASALKSEASFALLGRTAGLHGEELAKYSKRFTALSANLAAVGGTSRDQAMSALQSGLRGRGTALKQYGVVLSTTAQQAEALHKGIIAPVKDQAKIETAQAHLLSDQKAYSDAVTKSGSSSLAAQKAHAALGAAQETLTKAVAGSVPALTDQQKALAAQSLILRQAAPDAHAFADQSDLLVNKQAKLAASMDNVKDKIGTALLPIEGDLVDFMLNKGVPALETFSDWFEKKGVPGIHDLAGELKPLAHEALPAVKTVLGDVVGIVQKIEPAIAGIVRGFNHMPAWAQKAVVGVGVAGYAANKLGLLSRLLPTKGGGLTNEIASIAKPLPVFVTNEGFGTGTPGTSGEPGGGEPVVTPPGGEPGPKGLKIPPGITGDFAEAALHIPFLGLLSTVGVAMNSKLQGPNMTTPYGIGLLGETTLDVQRHLKGQGLGVLGNTVLGYQHRHPGVGAATRGLLDGGLGSTYQTDGKGLTPLLSSLKTANQGSTQLDRTLRSLPLQVQSQISAPGLIQTRAQVEDLANKYKLTTGQKQAVFTIAGVPAALSGLSAIESAARSTVTAVESIANVHTGAATGPVSSPTPAAPSHTHIHVNVDGKQLAHVVHTTDRATEARQ